MDFPLPALSLLIMCDVVVVVSIRDNIYKLQL